MTVVQTYKNNNYGISTIMSQLHMYVQQPMINFVLKYEMSSDIVELCVYMGVWDKRKL